MTTTRSWWPPGRHPGLEMDEGMRAGLGPALFLFTATGHEAAPLPKSLAMRL